MKLLLADDHTLFRDALLQYIERAEPGAKVTLAKDFPEVLKAMEVSPDQDLILLDLRMPGMNGMDGFKTVKEKYPDVPVALMSGIAESHDVQAAMNLGAIGYFPKTLSGKALIQAIQLVLTGEKFVPLEHNGSGIMPSYYDSRSAKKEEKQISSQAAIKLTPRERQVLTHLIKGASNKEIASALDLQVVTIKLHVRSICRKLDAKNRTQAALKAQELGLVS